MTGIWDPLVVARSLAIATIASYAALELYGRAGNRQGWGSWTLLAAAALFLGAGMWSMHFIGMLAFRLPVDVAFERAPTILSLVIAVGSAGIALLAVRGPAPTASSITAAAVLLGAGIGAMHYTGMSAMRMSPPIEYRPALVAASVSIAIAAAYAALWLALRLRQRHYGHAFVAKLGSAILMGCAIGGMHYTGMAAANFAPGSLSQAIGAAGSMDRDATALILGLATLGIVAMTLSLAARDAHQAAHGMRLADSLRSANEQLRALALHDSLTGLPNRMLLDDRLAQAATRARRSGKSFAFMFLDLDRFKPVNDSFGHAAGDQLLVAVAKRLVDSVRKPDTVARTGGDEFAILLSEIEHPRDAALVSAKILDELSRPFFFGSHEVNISGSIGISVYPADGRDVDTLKAHADAAMYRAKREGRNGYRFFAPLTPAKDAA